MEISLNLSDKGIMKRKGSMPMTYSDWNSCRLLITGVNGKCVQLTRTRKTVFVFQLFTPGWLSLAERFNSSTRKDSFEVILT